MRILWKSIMTYPIIGMAIVPPANKNQDKYRLNAYCGTTFAANASPEKSKQQVSGFYV